MLIIRREPEGIGRIQFGLGLAQRLGPTLNIPDQAIRATIRPHTQTLCFTQIILRIHLSSHFPPLLGWDNLDDLSSFLGFL